MASNAPGSQKITVFWVVKGKKEEVQYSVNETTTFLDLKLMVSDAGKRRGSPLLINQFSLVDEDSDGTPKAWPDDELVLSSLSTHPGAEIIVEPLECDDSLAPFGTAREVCASWIVYPFTYIKNCSHVARRSNENLLRMVLRIVRQEGPSAFYNGSLSSILIIPEACMMRGLNVLFTTFPKFGQFFVEHGLATRIVWHVINFALRDVIVPRVLLLNSIASHKPNAVAYFIVDYHMTLFHFSSKQSLASHAFWVPSLKSLIDTWTHPLYPGVLSLQVLTNVYYSMHTTVLSDRGATLVVRIAVQTVFSPFFVFLDQLAFALPKCQTSDELVRSVARTFIDDPSGAILQPIAANILEMIAYNLVFEYLDAWVYGRLNTLFAKHESAEAASPYMWKDAVKLLGCVPASLLALHCVGMLTYLQPKKVVS